MQNPNYLVVAAIDFGTTYSGYACSMKDSFHKDPLKIHANQIWNAGERQLMSLKTPTCLLLNSNKQFDAFGFEAENKYADLFMDNEHDEYYYFHRFKMTLHNNTNIKDDMVLEDITGKPLPAMDVFTHSIAALKEHLMLSLETQGTGVLPNEIQWVLTVPAIWTDNAKKFMRKCAEQAGIPGNILIISLEPEAASIYCQYLPTEKFHGSGSGFTMSEVGTKYLVADLGGGTADVTVHEKMVGNSLKELCTASGGSCGGTSVDAEFIQMLTNILGNKIMRSLKQEKPEAYLDLLRTFEIGKRTVTTSRKGKVNMSLPYITLDELCREHIRKDLKTAIPMSKYGDTVSIGGDKIRIDADLFKEFFHKTISHITKLLQEVLSRKESQNVSHILLVGGFSECTLVQDAIKKEFKNFRVVVPYESGLAVLKGAVLFGHKPEIIGWRKSRFTYGIATDPSFNPDIHDEQHCGIVNDVKRCIGWFDVIMVRNTLVQSGTKITRTYDSKLNFDTICVRIFTTEKDHPKYIDEDGCTLLGKIVIDSPDPSRIHKLDVEIIFGNTELSLEVAERSSNKKYNANFTLI